MKDALLSVSVPGLNPSRSGKVRDVFDLGDSLLIVSSDRISAFDVIMSNGVPDKGRILNQMSSFWFSQYESVCPNHILTTDDRAIQTKVEGVAGHAIPWEALDLKGRCVLAKKAEPLAIECVVRGYITGSVYKEYVKGGGRIHGFNLPDQLVDGSRLPEPIFTPATKAESGHDENISEAEAMERVGVTTYKQVRDWSVQIYKEAAAYTMTKGILLADTKFEFGLIDGSPIWIDEALTPDSSRFWPMEQYKVGQIQPSLDKQFVRNYLESIPWDKTPPGPVLPEDVVTRTRDIYLDIFTRLTCRPFAT